MWNKQTNRLLIYFTCKILNFQVVCTILFKLSTTGRTINSGILHLTAVSVYPDKCSFEVFIIPDQRISPEASNLHGISYDNHGEYFYQRRNGENARLEMLNPRDAFQAFLDWIEYIREDQRNRISLVSHNAHAFHIIVLVISLIVYL